MKNGLKEFKNLFMNTNEILFCKAKSFGYRSWFAKDTFSLMSYSLKNEKLFSAFDDAIEETNNLDCIWFDGDKVMPALFKICNENILEGLCRLNNVKELMPPYFSKYILVVDDNKYQTALDELMKPTFKNSGISIIKKSELSDATLN